MKWFLGMLLIPLLGAGWYVGDHLEWDWANRDRLDSLEWPGLPDLPGAAGSAPREAAAPRETAFAERREFTIWTQLEGELHSRKAQPVFSTMSHKALLTYLAPEGSMVRPGDRLAEFDGLELEEKLAEFEKGRVLAQADYDGLQKADLPMELAEIDQRVSELRRKVQDQTIILRENEMLHRRGLISDRELEKQQLLFREFNAEIQKLGEHRELTRTFLHPSRLLRARTALEAVQTQLASARQQVAGTTVTAPVGGTVVYHPLHVDGEFRTVRVGDTVFRNQKFMIVADMENLVVRCEVPEGQLAQIREGNYVMVSPVAFPAVSLEGEVESVGTMAHTVSGRSSWQKYFTVTIRLDESNPRLRSGMSVRTRILAYHKENALVVPRRAVRFREDRPVCHVPGTNGTFRVAPLQTGSANPQWVEVLNGLEAGDEILLP